MKVNFRRNGLQHSKIQEYHNRNLLTQYQIINSQTASFKMPSKPRVADQLFEPNLGKRS